MSKDMVLESFEEMSSGGAQPWREDVPHIQAWRRQAANANEELTKYIIFYAYFSATSERTSVTINRALLQMSFAAHTSTGEWKRRPLIKTDIFNYMVGFISTQSAQLKLLASLPIPIANAIEDHTAETASVFQELVMKWKKETAYVSSFTDLVMNDNYQKIIGMGPEVVPLLLKELMREPNHWFWALAAITRENPIDDADAGDVVMMTKRWLSWGKSRGHV